MTKRWTTGITAALGTIDIELNPRSGEQIEYRHQ
jgi:hypothetical protein